jgi:hypothetical protein
VGDKSNSLELLRERILQESREREKLISITTQSRVRSPLPVASLDLLSHHRQREIEAQLAEASRAAEALRADVVAAVLHADENLKVAMNAVAVRVASLLSARCACADDGGYAADG